MNSRTRKHPARATKRGDHLAEWIAHPQAALYFGPTFPLRLEILAVLITHRESLAAVARRHYITRQAVHKHAKLARGVFGIR